MDEGVHDERSRVGRKEGGLCCQTTMENGVKEEGWKEGYVKTLETSVSPSPLK
jgi:hypothetical protein